MMREPVEHGGGHLLVAEDLGPFPESEAGGDDHRGLLVDRPSLTGGAEELVRSASVFTVLDLDFLEKVLKRHDIANLWAATGWFLERFQKTFHVPEKVLSGMEKRRPRSKQYLERDRRGGILAKRWNLILPKEVIDLGEPNER